MQNLKLLLTRPLQALPNSLAIIILVIAIIGFADAGYLTIEHYQGNVPPCSITGGCEKVLTSSYSVVLGVPVSLAGAIYYVIIAAGALAYLEGKHEKIFRWTLLLTVFGLIFSLWFMSVQAFILDSYCMYCIGSAVSSTLLFIVAGIIFAKYRSTDTLSA